uniref:DUF397 domain-containing protein n=1 Tax=Spirillospora sp. NPDC047279 TaxID=3155478 RepID=UPI0033C513FD
MTSPDRRHLRWRKSSYTGSAAQDCVEVARADEREVAVRDSKDPDGPMLMLTGGQWETLLRACRVG